MINVSEQADALLLVGHGSQDAEGVAEYHQLARLVAERLKVAVQPCFLEFAEPSVVQGIEGVVAEGARRVVVVPLFLGPAGHQKNDVPVAINWGRAKYPQVTFQYGTPLGAQYHVVSLLSQRGRDALAASPRTIADAETALVVVGRGSRDPDSNTEVARIARLLYEGRGYGWVEPAYYSLTTPGVETVIERCIKGGARRVVVLPYLLFTGKICARIGEQAQQVAARYPAVEVLVGQHLGSHIGIAAAVAQRYDEALAGTAAMTCDLCKYRQRFEGFEDEYGQPQASNHAHGLRGAAHGHGALAAIPLLPARYAGGAAVSAAPMSASDLVYDAEGRVAWDKMWGLDDPNSPFCELALAGGPSHRATLLEPVTPAEVAADLGGYGRVLGELKRGITLVTGRAAVVNRYPGWIGVQCDDEQMALWLLRAVLVENISVRREGSVLFFPAGPAFRLDGEIKNVITALAKTHHYWQEHVRELSTGDKGTRRPGDQETRRPGEGAT